MPNIGKLIAYLNKCANLDGEIIVCDGGSSDNTCNEAEKAGALVKVSPKKGRAAQALKFLFLRRLTNTP